MRLTSDIFQQLDQFDIHYLSPLGLELRAKSDLQFTAMMPGAILQELVKTFRLVLLRGFSFVDKPRLVEYAQTIGELLEWEFGHVMEMRAQDKPANYLFTHGPVPFHWDGAFYQVPRYLLFHCIEAPQDDCGGETLFTDTNLIWKNASVNERKTWSRYQLTYQTEKLAHYGGCITEPLIQTHPETNETILRFAEAVPATMLNPVDVSVQGLNQEQSHQFVNSIAERCYQDAVCYTHVWQQNDFLLADNHALIHARRAFTDFSPRHLRRIQVL